MRYGFLLCKSREVHILELDLASLVDILCLLIVEDIGILDGNVVNHSLCAVSHDAVLASANIHIADVDVLEVWKIFLLHWGIALLGSHMVVEVGGLKGDGISCDICHIDMVDEDVLRGAASFHGALESQTGICALKSVVANHDVVYDEYILAARDVDCISVLCIPGTLHGNAVDDDILASGRDEVEAWTV